MADRGPIKATSDAAGDAAAVAGRSLTGRPDRSASVSSVAQQQQHQNYQQQQQHRRQRSGAEHGALRPAPAPAAVNRPQPAVYWNDKKSSMEQLPQQQQQQIQHPQPPPQRTFFEDSTPPPSPSYLATSSHSLSTRHHSSKGSAAAIKDGGYDYRYDHVAPPAPIPPRERLFGLRKKTLWIIVGVVAVVILGLAIGLGVGLGQNKDSSKGAGDKDGASSTNDSSATASSHPSRTSSSPKETSTTSTHASTVCPAANNTLYDVPQSDKTFLRLCGIDYTGEGAADDLATVWTASMQDCIINCVGYDGCTACSWGAIEGDNYRDNHRCFLKTNLAESKKTKVRAGWDFAIMQ